MQISESITKENKMFQGHVISLLLKRTSNQNLKFKQNLKFEYLYVVLCTIQNVESRSIAPKLLYKPQGRF